jgi:Protein of unknown function (DUF1592)/Protein of unknown function (DUF1588)/Protein of unknown function (DUF1595)/Protein of unknown function (DUF1585)/Protein of unknown function (DUF1587)
MQWNLVARAWGGRRFGGDRRIPAVLAALLGGWACAAGPGLASKDGAAAPAPRASSVTPATPMAGSEGQANPKSASASAVIDGYELPVRTPGKDESFPPSPLVPLAADTRLARLSHSQYQHTVQDLFGIRESLGLTFAPDARNGFGFDTSNAFRVDPRLGPQYRALAEALAQRATGDPVLFARIVPCDTQAPGCREQFLSSFGERAFRRPLDARDLETFRALFDSAAALAEGGDAFTQGVRLTLETMLQAPEFLYRTESSRHVGPDGRVHLDDFEIASRLSYFLHDSMPDELLFGAARAGQLHTPDQVEAAARRMLSEPRVLEKLVAFHDQAWQFGRFAHISPDAEAFPNLPKGLVWRVRQATALFVRDILRGGGGLEELLTAPYAYVDAGLAPLYGLKMDRGAGEPAPGRFTRVSFDPAERKGLLMQVGYLASNAYSVHTDPIHRGLFVIRYLLCRDIPDPPPGATSTPPPETDRPIVTTRDEVDLVTGQSFCPTCHSEINAPGYAFEGFDAIGQHRTLENGVPVDTSASMVLDGRRVSFDGPAQLVDELAQSKEAHRCYSRRWLEFAYGRPLAESDLPTLDAIAANSLPIADIIVAIVRSPEFLSFAPSASELPAVSAAGAGAAPEARTAEGRSQ